MGGAVLAEAAFRRQLEALLERRVTTDRDRPLLAAWQGTVAAPPPQPQAAPDTLPGWKPAKLPDGA